MLAAMECDADLHELAQLSSAEYVARLPGDWETPPFEVGQLVMVNIGTATDGILSTEAYVESAQGEHGPELRLRILAPLRRQQRRFDVRLPLDIPARRTLRLSQAIEPEPLRSRVLDISAGGVLLQTGCQLRTGERMVVAFTLPGDGVELRVAMVVRYCRQPNPDEHFRWESGCQFQVLRPADRERIARYIFTQQRDAARRQRAMAS